MAQKKIKNEKDVALEGISWAEKRARSQARVNKLGARLKNKQQACTYSAELPVHDISDVDLMKELQDWRLAVDQFEQALVNHRALMIKAAKEA